jgi:hypothetical protein
VSGSEGWHNEASLEKGGTVEVSRSFYLLLQWHKATGRYKLFQLPDSKTLSWEVNGRRLLGRDEEGVMIEWYGHSGGQLKYYPFADKAIRSSEVFKLEPLPASGLGYGLKRRVLEYFPDLWGKADKT